MRKHLRVYAILEEENVHYFVINTEKSGPDLRLATGDSDVRTFDLGAPFLDLLYLRCRLYTVELVLCTNNFGGTKLKKNYIWEYANKKFEYHRSKEMRNPRHLTTQ
jgi:hypothetical protein